jgi:hypothetical protein
MTLRSRRPDVVGYRRRMTRIAALLAVLALAAAPAAAPVVSSASAAGIAQQQQEQPGGQLLQDSATQPAPQPQQAPAQQTTELDSGSIGWGDLLLIGLGIVALIGGIWFVIARDARRATAGRVRTGDAELGGGRGGSATRAARRTRRLSAEERRRRKRGRAR